MNKMTFEVCFLKSRPKYISESWPNAYSFQKDKKFHWLQKTCFYILEKLKANHTEIYVKNEIVRSSFKEGDLIYNIRKHYKNILDMIDYREDYQLFVSPEIFEELLCVQKDSLMDVVHFNYTSDRYYFSLGNKKELPIIMLPYMTGYLLVPSVKYFV